MKRFLDMPLWLSIPLALIYFAAWVGFLYTLYYYSGWRRRRIKKTQNNQK